MIIYKKGFFCFYPHIPKTGGTSVKTWLAKNNFHVGTLRIQYETGKSNPTLMDRNDHVKTREVLKLNSHYHEEMYRHIYDLENFDHSFTIVRNPINKVISDYFYHVKLGYDHRSLDDFCSHMKNAKRQGIDGLYGHLRTQQEFIGTTIKNVYRFEDGFDSIFRSLSKHLPEVEDFRVPHKMAAPVPYDPVEIWESCSAKSKTIVEVLFGEDFEKLKYDFRPEPNNVRD